MVHKSNVFIKRGPKTLYVYIVGIAGSISIGNSQFSMTFFRHVALTSDFDSVLCYFLALDLTNVNFEIFKYSSLHTF